MRRFVALLTLTAAALTGSTGMASASQSWSHLRPASQSWA